MQNFRGNPEGNPYIQVNIFTNLIYKKDFSIHGPMTICIFRQKLAQNKYMCIQS